jgi:glycosyltransferase involved in cell wall biosynthesis
MATQLNTEDVTKSTTPVRRPSKAGGNEAPPLVSVVMPCLNEARTVASCIREAFAGLAAANLDGEIIIADNGSSDESVEIAIAEGARVVHVSERGYGSALRGGFAAARGKYIVMGDADGSYDFGEIPRFVAKLEEGYDLVMGNRFAGGIEKGAMPWHHRYIGNPVLSGIGRVLHGGNCRDWHCGLRAFHRSKLRALELKAFGMELASELVIQSVRAKWIIAENPITLRKDGRDRRPHLRSIRDGLRHLSLIVRLHKAKLKTPKESTMQGR